jgi:hypothetical protein
MASANPSKSVHHLQAYISLLRKKIEIDPALPNVIITHHKLGYSFAGKEEARWFPEGIDFSGGIWHSGMNWLTILPSTRFFRL